jgi:hypothetical protein
VPEVVKVESSKSSVSIRDIYIDGGYIEVEDTGLVSPTEKWKQNKTEVSDTLDSRILRSAETGCLYLLDGKLFMWAMPSVLLCAGKSLTILTYKAEGSLLVPYLNRLSMPHIIEQDKYREEAFREQAVQLLNLENIPAFVGKKNKPNLSYTAQATGMKNKRYYTIIRNSLKNLSGRDLKEVDKNNILITCIKDAWFDKSGKAGVFAKESKLFEKTNWCANTTRGTNKYDHCSHLIYLYDQNINPIVGRWLNDNSTAFNNAYALTELIQWVWRSRIRKGEPITLYLPAPRMRGILIDWLEGSTSFSFNRISIAA